MAVALFFTAPLGLRPTRAAAPNWEPCYGRDRYLLLLEALMGHRQAHSQDLEVSKRSRESTLISGVVSFP